LPEDIIESYTKNGFAIVKNIVPAQRINSLLENIFNLFCRYSTDYQELKNMEKPWNTELFHKKLIEFRQKDPESFGAIYDSLKTSLTLTQLITDNKVVDFVAKFLKIKPSDLSISEPMCRLDVPNDKRNTLDWHQERSFFPQNRNGLNGLVCWIPLTDITEEMGPMHISPRSHAEGQLKLSNKTKKNTSYTTQIPVPEEFVSKYEDLAVRTNVGDAVFFNMLLFHRSGQNISNKVRLATQGRFHTSTADDFIPFDLINYYNPFIKQKLEKKYDCSDIPNNERQSPVATN
tara:strand:+ start:141 stop:1007 length:867 start_codon:yes stop_codon:yes gene_type:complete